MLTRSGLGAAIAALALLAAGLWWRYEELVTVAVAIVVALAVALWSARVPHRARIVRTVTSPRVARGDPIRIIYRATNTGRRRSAPATILDSCGAERIAVALPAIPADDRTEVVGLIPTHRRGVFTVGPWALQRVDPFGLAIGGRTSDVTSPMIVHPRIHALHGPAGAMHSVSDDAAVRRSASDPLSGFVSLRPYVEGDDPRLIHWPTTARVGTLMLREHVELRRPELTVVLDASGAVAGPDDFEEMVDVAASVAVHAIRSGVDVRVRTTSRRQPGALARLTRDAQVLDLLTPIVQADPEPDPGADPGVDPGTRGTRGAGSGGADSTDGVMPLAELFRTGLDHTTIVFVTGPDGPSSMLRHAASLALVRIGETAVGGPGVILAAADAAEFARRWRS